MSPAVMCAPKNTPLAAGTVHRPLSAVLMNRSRAWSAATETGKIATCKAGAPGVGGGPFPALSPATA